MTDFCNEDPEAGNCRNGTNMYFFNKSNSRCEIFTWSCGEHGNRFETYAECIELCGAPRSRGGKNRNNRKKNNS